VTSAGPYASLHLAPDRHHASSPPLSFLQAGCPSCQPTNSVKALKALKWVIKWLITTVTNMIILYEHMYKMHSDCSNCKNHKITSVRNWILARTHTHNHIMLLCSSTCVNQHPQLRTGGSCWKTVMACMPLSPAISAFRLGRTCWGS